MLVLKRFKIIGLLSTFMVAVIFFACVNADIGNRFSRVYGSIIARDKISINNAVIEQIDLYPKKEAHSTKQILRKAILVKKNNAKGTVLISHGFMCSKEDVAFLRSIFPDYNIMTFDMRAHGEHTKGQRCTFGRDEAYDVIAAALFLRNHPDIKELPLMVYGFSMGAVAAIEAQAKNSKLFDGMILDCPFDATENIIKKGLEHMKFSIFGHEIQIPGRELLQKYVFHPYVQSFVKLVLKSVAKMDTRNIKVFMPPLFPAESIRRVSVPLLMIHCKNDKKIPVAAVKKVYNNASSAYKKLWITGGRRHYDSFFHNPEEYTRRVNKFAKKIVTGVLGHKKKQKIIENENNKSVAVHVDVGHEIVRSKK